MNLNFRMNAGFPYFLRVSERIVWQKDFEFLEMIFPYYNLFFQVVVILFRPLKKVMELENLAKMICDFQSK